MRRMTLFGFAVLFCAATASAQVRFYDVGAGTDNLWTNVSNWEYKPSGSWIDYGKLPESTDSVIISYSDSVVIDAAGSAVANIIELGKWKVTGNLTTTADGTLTTTAGISMNGDTDGTNAGEASTLTNYGTNTIGGTLSLNSTSNRVYNAGQLSANTINLASVGETDVGGGTMMASTALFTNDVTGVINVSGTQQFGNGAGSSVTFVNAGINLVTGNIETMGNGAVTIDNSGFMSSVSNKVIIRANTELNNTGTIESYKGLSVNGGAVVNDGTMKSLRANADAGHSTFKGGFSLENTTNGTFTMAFHADFSQGTFTNRGAVGFGKYLRIAVDGSDSGESIVYNDEDGTMNTKQIYMGVKADCADGYLINKGTLTGNDNWSATYMQNGKQTIQNDGTMRSTSLDMATVAGSLSTLSNTGTLNMNNAVKSYFKTVAGTSVLHNASTGIISLEIDMTLSASNTAFTSIENWGEMAISGNLILAGEGNTEFTMLGGTLSVNALTNGVGTGVLYVHGGTSTFSNVTIFDSTGDWTIDVRDPGVLVVEGTDLVSEFNTARGAGDLTGGPGLDVTYDGSDTIVTSPTIRGTVISIH